MSRCDRGSPSRHRGCCGRDRRDTSAVHGLPTTAMLIRTDLRPIVALVAGLLLSGPLAAQSAYSSLDAGPLVSVASSGVRRSATGAMSDTVPRRRPRAIEYSDWYARRATIHR